ncbi:hypothetical protein BGC_08750 [Burkholderia sp. 3C]
MQVPVLLDKLAALLRIEWERADAAAASSEASREAAPDDGASPVSMAAATGAAATVGGASPSPTSSTPAAASAPTEPPRLPRSMHAQLRALLDVGYVEGLIEALDAAVARRPALAAPLAALRARAELFQLKEFEHELDRLPLGADD